MAESRSSLLRRGMRLRFYAEAGLGALSAVTFAVTALVPDWIERVFGVDPDHGNGAAELGVCVLLLAVAVVMGSLARSEWRHWEPAADGGTASPPRR